MPEFTTPRSAEAGTVTAQPTQHAMLVVWGQFARTLGLPAAFAQVPVPQKTVRYSPADKLCTFFVGLLSGMEFLTDLIQGPIPVAADPAVATAWDLPAVPDASGVSRTLAAATPASLTALQTALDALTQPFLQRAITDLRTRRQPLLLDADLTGRPVSATSPSYSDAAFGYMDGAIRRGYQVAEICLQTVLFGRQWLAGQQHPGDTVSAPCLLDLVAAAERQLGCHPRRRVELLDARIAEWTAAHATWLAQAAAAAAQAQERTHHLGDLSDQIDPLKDQIAILHQAPTASSAPGQLTRLQERLTRLRRRAARISTHRSQAWRQGRRYREGAMATQAELTRLQARRDALAAENATQPDAPRVVLRMDAGFSSGANLTALLELGYEIETKSGNAALIAALRKRVTPDMEWTPVGQNAAMVGWTNYRLQTCPYPLTVGLERFQTPQGAKYAVLRRSQDDAGAPVPRLPAWFRAYNGRQTIEAGIKETKTVFRVQHLMSRDPIGMQIQVALTLFAANFVRWAAEWVRPRLVAAQAQVQTLFHRVKQMVRIAANSAAVVETHDGQVLVRCSPTSSLRGVVIHLTGGAAVQLALPLYEPGPLPGGARDSASARSAGSGGPPGGPALADQRAAA